MHQLEFSSLFKVAIQPAEPVPIDHDILLPPSLVQHQRYIREILQNPSNPINIEGLLRHIHQRFHDQGVVKSLIHRLFTCSEEQLAYYVPQLAYVAIRRPSEPMKRLLIHRAHDSQSLRRLVLWNVKAFTAMMKQRSAELNHEITNFQEELTRTVPSKKKFHQALKAISMLTEASLILKKLDPQTLAEKLDRFTRRFNQEYLNTTDHHILIPFRREQNCNSKYPNSNFVVGIVEGDCACFPTRKRVPYRIIIETIDQKELKQKTPKPNKTHTTPSHDTTDGKQKEIDLYELVTEEVEKMLVGSSQPQNLYVKDQTQGKRLSEMKNYIMTLQQEQIKKQQQQEKVLTQTKSFLAKFTSTLRLRSSQRSENQGGASSVRSSRLGDREGLKALEAIVTTNRKRFSQDMEGMGVIREYSQENSRIKSESESGQSEGKGPSKMWGKAWRSKQKVIKSQSRFGHFKSYRLRNVVVKGGDDLRQEIICMQLVYKIEEILREANLQIVVKPYEIIVLSENSGLLEFVSNSISVDYMKKNTEDSSLTEFYTEIFGSGEEFNRALDCFVRSLAGSAILTYVLKLKDRHNGNILLDREGHIIQIDFGFILGLAPGNINFESSPFKLTQQYLDLMSGRESPYFQKFVDLFCSGMSAIRMRLDELTLILEIMMQQSDLECFKQFEIGTFRRAFREQYSEQRFEEHCVSLVERSCLNSRTVHYDTFQYYTNNIHR